MKCRSEDGFPGAPARYLLVDRQDGVDDLMKGFLGFGGVSAVVWARTPAAPPGTLTACRPNAAFLL